VSNGDLSLILQLRLPRVLMAFAVGGLLAMSGALLQVLTRNPLAEPSVMGVSGGASVGALMALMMGVAGTVWVGLSAWCGAMVVMLFLTLLSGGLAGSSSRLILSGVMIATGCGAMTSLLITFASDAAMPGMIHWLMGDLDSVMDLEAVGLVLGLWLAILIIVMRYATKIHMLQFGHDKAQSLGVDVQSLQWVMILMSSLATAAAVSVAGSIGFVGLLIPHVLRAVVVKKYGADQSLILPASAFIGGAFLVIADMFARTVIAPAQLPVGVITALIGVPSFLWLLNRLKYWNAS
jgi:iron complex transport system permease protein